jgi:hypothetical protein
MMRRPVSRACGRIRKDGGIAVADRWSSAGKDCACRAEQNSGDIQRPRKHTGAEDA